MDLHDHWTGIGSFPGIALSSYVYFVHTSISLLYSDNSYFITMGKIVIKSRISVMKVVFAGLGPYLSITHLKQTYDHTLGTR
jgi:hypothetical protein